MRNVIIGGAGQVGYQIARRLNAENYDVTVIDTSESLVSKVSESLDLRGVVGHAGHPDTLDRAGARDADMLIAATASDEVNMVACQVAHTLFEVPQKIARVRRPEYLKPQWSGLFGTKKMSIDVIISPEVEVAQAVLRRLNAPSAFDSAPFLDGQVRLIGARVEAGGRIVGTPLRQIESDYPDLGAVVLAFVRDRRLRSAGGDVELQPGDEVFFCAPQDRVETSLRLLGHQAETVDRVILVGGGNIGVKVALELERAHARSKLIEQDRDKAERAAELLDRTIVIHGDGLNSEILDEANVADAHAIVALTQDDKVNVLGCALAKQMGCPHAIALTNEPSFSPLAEPLGIDAFVNPRSTTVSTILRHVRRGRIRALHTLREGEAEVFETQVLNTSPMAGKRIADLELPDDATIGAILTKDGVKRPSPDLIIEAEDIVVMFAMARDLKAVENLFRVSIDFF
ncbi:MAG: Trk system potassium transporter TrkA [Pseudomonadota bacterium]